MLSEPEKCSWLTTVVVAAMIIILGGFSAAPSKAAWPDTSAFSNAQELSDSELSGMRGRYVSGNQVMYFGVTMSTHWTTAAGEILNAQTNLVADVSGNIPVVTFQPNITVDTDGYTPPSGNNNPGSIVYNPAGHSDGTQQIIQVAGDGNAIHNRFHIEITDGSLGDLSQSGNGKTQVTTAAGSKISIHNQPGGFGISMTVPGAGSTTQKVVSSQGLRQLVQVNSNMQRITNVTTLRVQLQNQVSNHINMSQMNSAIQAARQLHTL